MASTSPSLISPPITHADVRRLGDERVDFDMEPDAQPSHKRHRNRSSNIDIFSVGIATTTAGLDIGKP